MARSRRIRSHTKRGKSRKSKARHSNRRRKTLKRQRGGARLNTSTKNITKFITRAACAVQADCHCPKDWNEKCYAET